MTDDNRAGALDRLIQHGPDKLEALGVGGRLQALDLAGRRFRDPHDPIRIEAEARVPEEAHLTPEATRPLLDALAAQWTSDALRVALEAEFPDLRVLDSFIPGPQGESLKAMPPRLLVQYGSGNVPGTSATALVRALLVGAPTVVKPGQGDRVLPELLGRALLEVEPSLQDTFLVGDWRGGQGGHVEERCLAAADRMVIYGGLEAVKAVRHLLPPLTPLDIYGPRISGAILLAQATSISAHVEAAADAICAYEQRGCVSPQVFWVQESPDQSARAWAEALAEALERRPSASVTTTQVVAMRAEYEAARYAQALDPEEAVFGSPQQGWMVLYTPRCPQLTPTCLGRTVRVHGFSEASEVLVALKPMTPYLQTMAVEGDEPGRLALVRGLAQYGVTRVTSLKNQPWPPIWWKEDGTETLRSLVRWCVVEP